MHCPYQCDFSLHSLLKCDFICVITFYFCGRKCMHANQQRPTCPQTYCFCLISLIYCITGVLNKLP